jgi:hypothetical protein
MNRSGAAWDILVDGEGAASPVFNPIAPIDPTRYVEVGAVPVPSPNPPPTPPFDLSPVLVALAELKADIAKLLKLIEEHDAKSFPNYKGKVWGAGVTLRPEGH